MADEKHRVVRNSSETRYTERGGMAEARGGSGGFLSFLAGALVVAAIIALVFFAGGFDDPNTVLEVN